MTEEKPQPQPQRRPRQQRKQVLLRLDPLVYEALARWAGEELRSSNAQIEFLLRRALSETGRLPGAARPIASRGRPAKREGTGPEGAAPEDAVPGRTTPEDAIPENTDPEHAIPENTTPEDATPGNTHPEDAAPESTTPGSAKE
ncbi:hypothetical protein [Streptomyces tsukubensis]|uniref:hypothetical protein n=1 Tax=Streptomyces tsukubensis TaxID=83656 RepID=UPI0026CEB537